MGETSTEEAAWRALRDLFGDAVTRSPEKIESYAWDFGGLVRRAPAIAVEPSSVDEVLSVLRIANEHATPVSVRGSGHSQSGQCLSSGSIVMEMRRLRAVRLNTAESKVVAEGGATWRDIVDASFAEGLLPQGLTLVVDTTIGGTLSVGGVGGESFRIGAQVDNVLSLDVATLDGGVTHCSLTENRDLFDCVRGGLGQCGIILRAEYPLRRCAPRIRTYFFAYDDAEACVSDLVTLGREPRSELVLGFLTRTDGKWRLLLSIGKEFDGEETVDAGALRGGLRFSEELPSADAPLWSDTGIPGHIFFRMHSGTFWNQGGAPPTVHPWVDHVFSPDAAVTALDQMLKNPPTPLGMGTCGLIPVSVQADHAPLFAVPDSGGLFIGLGMFPNVPAGLRNEAMAIMSEYSRTCCDAGGKRYLSGYVDFTTRAEWREHYGPQWEWFTRMKERFDPRGLLNAGFLTWR